MAAAGTPYIKGAVGELVSSSSSTSQSVGKTVRADATFQSRDLGDALIAFPDTSGRIVKLIAKSDSVLVPTDGWKIVLIDEATGAPLHGSSGVIGYASEDVGISVAGTIVAAVSGMGSGKQAAIALVVE